MADLNRFREKITEYRLLAGRTQTELAIYINLDHTELSNRLRGNKKARLTFDNVRAIIRALAHWGAINTQAQARELFQLLDCPPFDAVDWNAHPLNKLAVSPNSAPALTTSSSKMTTPELPGGVVTFLFTDIEGSTRLWENYPALMSSSLQRHDLLLRGLIEQYQGQVFKTVGDAFHAAFTDPRLAVDCAVQLQQALVEETWPVETGPLKVRMALHSGLAEKRDGDYFGRTLNVISRILAAGHGGQILISQTTLQLLHEQLPEGATLHDLGEHRLKDLTRPLQLFQVKLTGLPGDFPPLKTLSTIGDLTDRDLPIPSHNLPAQLTSFVGREEKLAELRPLLEPANLNCRLLTLVGTGGTGKTRLALRLVNEMLNRFKDGVWLIELASISTPSLLVETVAKVLGIKERPGEELRFSLAHYLKPRQILLVLDNCEHLLDECAQLVEYLLQNCAFLKILTTSREPLAIRGEITQRVSSLQLPNVTQPASNLEDFTQCESVKLFVERAREIQPRFKVTAQNAQALAHLCHQLDGIPLALELAAARVQVMTVEQIDSRLHRRFQLLTGGSATALPRQKTLRGLLDWSYEMLSPEQKALFESLSVFAGSWSLEAAEAVCTNEYQTDSFEILDILTQLVNKSLVSVEEYGSEMRYRMLETLRQYGWEKLSERGNTQLIQQRHSLYYLELAQKAEPELMGAAQSIWLVRLEQEHDNLRTALLWLLKDPTVVERVEVALQLVGSLWRFWWLQGFLSEGRRWLEQALAITGLDKSVSELARAKALKALGTLCNEQTDYVAARHYYQESLNLMRTIDDKAGIAGVVSNLGVVAYDQGEYDQARTLYEEGLTLFRELGNQWAIGSALNNLGLVAQGQGDYVAAQQFLKESLEIKYRLEDKSGVVNTLSSLSDVLLDVADYPAAHTALREAISLNRDLNDPVALAHLLEYLAGLLTLEKAAYESALRLVGAAETLREQTGVLLSAIEQATLERRLQPAWDKLGNEAGQEARQSGTKLSYAEATEYALGIM